MNGFNDPNFGNVPKQPMVLTFEDYPVIPSGEYPATFVEVREFSGKFGPTLVLAFQIISSDGTKSVKVEFLTAKSLKPGNKLHKVITALNGQPVKGQPFDISSLIGNKCKVFVDVKEDKGEYRNVVVVVNPLNSPLSFGTETIVAGHMSVPNTLEVKPTTNLFNPVPGATTPKKINF
jgi:hypothetical protein